VIFDMGNKTFNFPYRVSLKSKSKMQIRHNALESTRIAVNKMLTDKVGDSNYYFKIKLYPHHVLRENTTASGAGADRFSTGMAHSFGKPIGLAAQIKRGQELMFVDTKIEYLDAVKLALKQATYKCPFKGQIEAAKK
jgi:large subunit ribosomal protein L10e